MHRTAHDRPRDHPDDLLLLAWARGAVDGGAADDVDGHLGQCVVCNVRVARLERVEGVERPDGGGPSPEVVGALVAASPVLPRARRRRPRDAPVERGAPLGLCRLTDGQRAAVVYVVEHDLHDETLTVCPVVFDRSLAEPGARIVPAGSSPLGVDVAVLCAVHVDVPASLSGTALGTLTDRPVAAPRAAWAAYRYAGHDLPSSASVHDEDTIDERRRLVAALASWLRPDETPASRAGAAVLAELAAELPFRWPGARVRDRRPPTSDDAPTIVAVVEDLDEYVYVAVVDGARRPQELTTPAALASVAELCHVDAATAVALVTADGTHAAVLSADDVAMAERASAAGTLPPVLRTRPVADALVAYLDQASRPDASRATPLDRRRLEALWHACLLEADEAHRAMDELFADGGL